LISLSYALWSVRAADTQLGKLSDNDPKKQGLIYAMTFVTLERTWLVTVRLTSDHSSQTDTHLQGSLPGSNIKLVNEDEKLFQSGILTQ
jgi:hypothetical protein